MTNEERRHNWKRFARASGEILAHPEAPEHLCETVARFLEEILVAEQAPAHFRRRLEATPDDIDPDHAPRRRAVTWGDFEDECMEFGSALASILADEMTPDRVRNAVSEFNTLMDEKAFKTDSDKWRQQFAHLFLPELLIIVANDDGDDQTIEAPETKPTWPTDEPQATPTTEAEMLIEIGRLREQLIAARKSEWGAHQAYKELEQLHGGGPVTVTIEDDDAEPADQATGATA